VLSGVRPEVLYGLPGLALLLGNVAADQIGLPIPALPALMLAGSLLPGHYGWGGLVLVGSTAASLAVDSAWYLAGRRFGRRLLQLICLLSITPDWCVADTERRFGHWGTKALLVAKFIPGFGRIAPPLAGAVRMPYWRFAYLTAAASALWVGACLLTGMLLGRQIRVLLARVVAYRRGALWLLAGLLAAYVALRWLQRYRLQGRSHSMRRSTW
jgi:membrane protein DedA with SNARE-associated domain